MLRHSMTIVRAYIILLDFIWFSISYVEMRVNIGLRFCCYLCWAYRAKVPSRCTFISGYFEHVASDQQHMMLERGIISTFLASFYLFFLLSPFVSLVMPSIACVLSHSVLFDSFVTPTDCSPPGSSVHGISQARIWSG